uniref:Odorant receptor n=1 Tax=Trichogramma kaykai TaxID=54128 RepID=A0ABD2VU34_9HYME
MITYGANQKKIAKILAQIFKDYEDPLLHKNLKEVHVALKYVKQVKIYLMVTVPLGFTNETMYFLKPLLENSFKVPSSIDFQNVTTYVLPYSVSFHIENDRGYWLALIYLIPMCYCAIFYSVDTILMLALLAHVCGQLAVLSECILPQIANDINTFSINTSFSIERHIRLIR